MLLWHKRFLVMLKYEINMIFGQSLSKLVQVHCLSGSCGA